jgi:hypothetical protein
MKFDYRKICLNLLKGFSQKTTDVLKRRFGLENRQKETLEAIGKDYGLTRERIRQIEREGFLKLREKIADYRDVFQYFKRVLESFGGFKKEEALLDFLIFSSQGAEKEQKKKSFSDQAGKKYQNEISFLLSVNSDFQKIFEDDDLYSFWTINKQVSGSVKKFVNQAVKFLQKKREKPFNLDGLLRYLGNDFQKILKMKLDKRSFQSCLEISKEIQKTPEGEYGLKGWLIINPRGIKDRAYLVLKKKKTPLHFREITALIKELPFPYPKTINPATVHNELIKNDHFVLVGRGLYGLREWGYQPGAVKDVIVRVLKEVNKPLAKEEVVQKVLKERFVKKNTVLLNLNDKNYFLRDDQGRYKIKEA